MYNKTQNCEVLKIKINSKLILKLTALFAVICLALCSCSININVNGSDSESKTTVSKIGTLSVHYLDVGQGDSIFIELPNQKCMLIDAGENMYGKSITEYINNLGYTNIDYLVATHPHADHIGSMAYVVKHNNIGEIYMPKVTTTTKTYENLLTAIADKGLKVKSAKVGMNIIDDNDFSINILAPVTIDEDNLNNCSVILKMTYKNDSFLFLGDAEKKELENNRQNELERARGAAQQIIERTKAQTNALIDELDTLRKEKEKKDFSKNVSDAKSKSKQVFNKLYNDANPVENSDDNSDYILPRPLKQGDSVYITDIGKSGIVSGKPDNSGQIYVQIGIMRTKVDIKKLRLEEKKKVTINGKQPNNSKRKNTTGKVSGSVSRSTSMELDIRGYASDEGTYEMEAFIDRAVMSGMHVVTIIHGKGTGVLRNAIRQKLRSIKSVKSFRPGVYGEGEDGVTVVELK